MRILLCNDDGVHAEGLKALHNSLRGLGTLWVVAPLEEKSTTGHSLTLHKPLRIVEFKDYGKNYFGVSGSPADCIHLGIKEIMKFKPDWVISGINRGANLGQDVYYSGTVSAAREAAMMGFRSIACSLVIDYRHAHERKLHYATAGGVVKKIIQHFQKVAIPSGTVLNVNVPDVVPSQLAGVRLTQQGFRHYSGSIWKRRDHRGKDYFWVGGTYKGFKNDAGTDCYDANNKFVTVTPLELDCTDHYFLTQLRLTDGGKKGKKPKGFFKG